MKKPIIITMIVVFISVGGYFGFRQYEQHKFIESILPPVKNSSLHLMNVVRYEIDDGTNISFKELFDKLEANIAEIDKRIIEVQTIATPAT